MKKIEASDLSHRVSCIPEALSIYINQIVYEQQRKGKDITVLSLGEAFFDIPMYDFGQLNFERGYHYSDSQGVPELRDKIAEYYNTYYRAAVSSEEEVLITAGSKAAIYLSMLAIVNPGEEILIHEPAWLSYQEQARLVEATIKSIPYDCDIENFESFISSKTKLMIINNPNNPSGKIYSESQLCSIYQQCQKHGIYLLVDEAYSDFVLDGKFDSCAKLFSKTQNVIVVNSLSKNLGMSGWRIGYIIAAPKMINAILKLNQHIITCAPTILQYYMAKYFYDILDVTLPQVRDVVLKRDLISKKLIENKLKYMGGESTFYFMVNIDGFPGSSLEFSLYLLLKHNIAVVPGSAYGQSVDRYVRVGVGAESVERIEEALKIIHCVLHSHDFDKEQFLALLKMSGIKMFETTEVRNNIQTHRYVESELG